MEYNAATHREPVVSCIRAERLHLIPENTVRLAFLDIIIPSLKDACRLVGLIDGSLQLLGRHRDGGADRHRVYKKLRVLFEVEGSGDYGLNRPFRDHGAMPLEYNGPIIPEDLRHLIGKLRGSDLFRMGEHGHFSAEDRTVATYRNEIFSHETRDNDVVRVNVKHAAYVLPGAVDGGVDIGFVRHPFRAGYLLSVKCYLAHVGRLDLASRHAHGVDKKCLTTGDAAADVA